MHLRPSRVLNKLRRGERTWATKINLADPRSAELAAMAGADCVWLDMEHVPNTLHDVENQVRAAKMYDTDALVRVPRGSYSDLIRPLEMDAAGIMVPHVLSADDARRIVRQTRFHPTGRRPLDGGNADGAYCQVPGDQYIEHANTQRLLVVQIEDPEALEHLDDIAALDGIDMLFFGPGDFAQGLGKPGQLDDPELQRARRLIPKAAREHGKFAGTACPPAQIDATTDLGYQFLCVGADVVALGQYFNDIAAQFGAPRNELNRSPYHGQ